jgi:hypothetical protein
MPGEAEQAVRGMVSDGREALDRQRAAVAVVESRSEREGSREIERGCIGGVAMTGTEERGEDAKVTGDARITSGALRMRRSRRRARHGAVVVGLEVGSNMTADLANLGWLPAPDRIDKDALAHALIQLMERAIGVRLTPAPNSQGKVSFMLEIQHSTIETLVALRWLGANQWDDLAAIATAFRRFAGRSLEIARNGGGVQ